MSFDFTYPTPLPSTKGWGPGYPDCQDIARAGPSIFWPGVHRDIAELVALLCEEMRRRGFVFLEPGCWGYGCRGTKASSGAGTATPSFHSWGLGFDINAPLNVFGAARSNTQLGKPEYAWVVDLWERYGFFWLGPSIKDWMHMSFVGSPADARDMTVKAREEIGDEMGFAEYTDGIDAFWAAFGAADGDPGPPPTNKPALFRKGWTHARRGANNPVPGAVGAHEHDVSGKAK